MIAPIYLIYLRYGVLQCRVLATRLLSNFATYVLRLFSLASLGINMDLWS